MCALYGGIAHHAVCIRSHTSTMELELALRLLRGAGEVGGLFFFFFFR